jgi:hypothetical protein
MKKIRNKTTVIPLNPGIWFPDLVTFSYPESEDGLETAYLTGDSEEFSCIIRTLLADLYPVLLAFIIYLPASGQL